MRAERSSLWATGLRSVAIRPGLSIPSDSQTCHLPVPAVEGNWSGSCFALMACGTLYLVMQGGVHCRVELEGMDHVATTGGEAVPSQFRKGVVELAILALLHNDEAYGAEIVDRLGEYPGLAISAGTAYPLLSSCLLYTSPSPRDGLLSRM